MRTVEELMLHLGSLNVELWADGDRLRYSAPKNVLTPELRAELSRLKPEIMLLLEEPARRPRSRPGPITPLSREVDLPLSSAQQRLWYLDQLAPDNSIHNTSLVLRFLGSLDVRALERGLSEVFRRHEALRTRFSTVDGSPVQTICPPAPVEMPVLDLRPLQSNARVEEVGRIVSREGRRPFDLATGPLMRFRLVQLAEEEHAFILSMHNITMDGWSFGVFFSELSALYEAFSSGTQRTLPELPFQYADFAAWQRSWLESEAVEDQLRYWRRLLARPYRPLRLPADRRPPPVETLRSASQSFSISRRSSEGLRALSRSEGATLFMTLLAALQVLLHRYTGQADVMTFSSAFPSAVGSDDPALRKLIGLFSNMLALRSDLDGDPSFSELLGRVCEVTLGAYDNGDLPFERVAEFLRPEQERGRLTPYQVMFVFQEGATPEMALSGLEVAPLGLPDRSSMFDLHLIMDDNGDTLRGTLLYKTDLFDDSTVSRAIAHYQNLLEAAIEDPRKRLSELPLLEDSELRRVILEWNKTATDYPSDKCIHELMEDQVERSPDAVAIVSDNHHLTFRELNRRANQLALYLVRLGVRSETAVGISWERSLEMVTGLLGILKAGGAYVTLSPSFTRERLAFILADAGISVLLGRGVRSELFLGQDVRILDLDSDWGRFAGASTENLTCSALAENIACVAYTPRSSARPNGLCFTHRAVAGSVKPSPIRDRFPEGVPVPQPTDLSSESYFELWGCLLNGGLLQLPGSGAASREASRDSSERRPVYWLQVSDARARPSAPLGLPAANTHVYILDRHLNPVPIGIPGEAYITGTVLPRCYLNQPGATAESFIPNPLGDGMPDRLHRTADLARRPPTGEIELLGHMDNRVMVRGRPVEPEEVQEALRRHPAVQRALVVAWENPAGGAPDSVQMEYTLVAYVSGDEDLSPWTLRKFLRKTLPGHMIPNQFIVIQNWPLAPGDEVDRGALPEPEGVRSKIWREYVPSTSSTEAAIAEIWRDALGVEQIGANDNFFDLGGHSLLAIDTISRMEKRLGRRISPKEIVFQTLGQIAASCEAQHVGSEAG